MPVNLSLRRDIVFVLLFSIFFWATVLPFSEYSGAVGDESGAGIFGMNLIKGTAASLPEEWYINSVTISAREIQYPTNFIGEFDFALPSYLVVPVFLVFGINVFSMKVLSVFFSWGLLVLCYIIIKKYFGFFTAALTAILAALSPAFIHLTWMGLIHQEIMNNFFLALAVLFLLIYRDKKKAGYFFCAAFLAGLTFSVKLSSPARFIAVTAAMMTVCPGIIPGWFRRERKTRLAAAVLFFSLGAGLFIHYNISTNGATFRKIYDVFLNNKISWSGESPLDVGANLSKRLGQLTRLVAESEHMLVPYPDRALAGRQTRAYLAVLFIAAFLINYPLTVLMGSKREKKLLSFAYICFVVLFILCVFSPLSQDPMHLAALYPFPQFALALFVYNLGKYFRKPVLTVIVSAAVILPYPPLVYRYMKVHRESGGTVIGSPAFDGFIEKLNSYGPVPVFMISTKPNMHHALIFMSGGDIKNIQIEIAKFADGWYFRSPDKDRKSETELGILMERLLSGYRQFLLVENVHLRRADDEREKYIRSFFFERLGYMGYGMESIESFENYYGDEFLEIYRFSKRGEPDGEKSVKINYAP